MAPSRPPHGEPRPGLDADALGPFAVALQSVSFVGPAFSALLLFPVVAGFAGVSVAFCFLVAGAIILMLALSLRGLAARFPSAGGYFTYVTRAVGKRMGVLISWIFLIYAPIAPGFIVAYTASVCVEALDARYGLHIPWWLVFVAAIAFVTVIAYNGIRLSTRALIALGLVEIAVVLGLALWGLASPGPGGFSLAPLSPGAGTGIHGIYLGVVFSLFAFAGWEGSVPLAEESRRPWRSVPLGLICAVLAIIVLFVVTTWGLMVGWGTGAVSSIASSTESPAIVLAQRYWGGAWVLLLLALLNSVICASIASFGTVTRMWFAMARSGLVRARLDHVNHRTRTPTNAVLLQGLLSLVVGLGFGLWLGPRDAFLTLSLLTTLALIVIYLAGNVGVVLFRLRTDRGAFGLLTGAVFPVLTSAAVLWVGYKSVNPLPPSPERYAAIAAIVWAVLGLLIAWAAGERNVGAWAADARLGVQERLALKPDAEA